MTQTCGALNLRICISANNCILMICDVAGASQTGGKHLTSKDYCYEFIMQVQTALFLLYILQHFGGISRFDEMSHIIWKPHKGYCQ